MFYFYFEGNLYTEVPTFENVEWSQNILDKIEHTPRQKSTRALEIFRVQKLILNATS